MNLSNVDYEVIKQTAQYVAINGQGFLQKLTKRLRDTEQPMNVPRGLFDFLRPNNNLFSYFTKLVEVYSLVIEAPPKIENNEKNDDKDA